MNTILEKIGLVGIVPVIAIDNAEDAIPLAQALTDGGLPCAEVTFRTSAAKEAIAQISKAYPKMLLGAGTVLTVDQVKSAVDSGAKYIVSPGLNTKVVEYCLKNNIAVTPGIATPTEVEAALELGLDVVKFFPAEANGGLPFLKAISAPYKNLKFIPTGGIDESNILSYLKFPKVLACGGSWMLKSELINTKQFDEIRRLASQAVHTMLGFELRHVGINNAEASGAMSGASTLGTLLGIEMKDGNSSVFVGGQFEFLKRMYLGQHGHLAIGTNFVHRAIAHFEHAGIHIKPETKNEKDGKLLSVYLDIEIGGFALHLLQI